MSSGFLERFAPAAAVAATLAAASTTAPAIAQGPGSTAAEVLKMTAGARAAAFAGAYTAMIGDPDGVFYNPASIAWIDVSAGLAYEAYVQDVSIGSLSGSFAPAGVHIGGGLVYLDAGDIAEVVPDPDYGGERGRETGRTVGATEAVGRLAAAVPLANDRAAVGLAVGVVTSDLAGVGRSTPFLDLGGQYRRGALSLGAALRNLGPRLDHDRYGGAHLPAEVRLGAAYRHTVTDRYGGAVSADLVVGFREETVAFAMGAEAGLTPAAGVSAVLRTGVTLGEGAGHLGRLRIGGGVGIGAIALDYTLQRFEYLGTSHRFGIRWTP